MSTALEPGTIGLAEARPSRARQATPRWLWAIAIAVLVPVVLPMLFLIAQVLSAGESAWSTLFSTHTLADVVRSLLFTAAVTGSAATIGLAAAWLTERTDIPFRHLWVVTVSLPLHRTSRQRP